MRATPLPVPVEWAQLLNPFASCLTKPQFNNFCNLTTAMVVSAHTSLCRYARLSGKHQSTMNDFLSISPWDDTVVHNRLRRLVERRISDAHIGIIDDTLGHHPYAMKMDYVDWYYDGLTKTKKLGHSIVTHGFHSTHVGFVPCDIELYKKDGRSKNDIACAMIQRTQRKKPLSLYVLDAWYSNRQVLAAIKQNRAHFITEIKSNRNVVVARRERYVREHEKHIPLKSWVEVKIKNEKYRYFQTNAHLKGIGSVNLVFSQKYEAKQWGETYYLISDVLTLCGERVIELFLVRGGIEGFHREAKQQLGMEHSTLRNSRGIERYLFLVLLVYVLLVLLNQQQMRHSFERKTIGQLRECLKAACYTTLLQARNHLSPACLETQAKMLAYSL